MIARTWRAWGSRSIDRNLMLRLLTTLIVIASAVSVSVAGTFAGAVSNVLTEVRLRWPTPEIKVAISSTFGLGPVNIAAGSDVEAALERSFRRWETAAGIRFEIVRTADANVSPAGRAGDGVSLVTAGGSAENMLLFAEGLEDSPAATRLFFDKAGNITEADIALNPMQRFSTTGEPGTYDLEAVLTHEIGHMLGLDHSPVFGALMYEHQAANGVFGIPGRQDVMLTAADAAALRAIYGPREDDVECCSEADIELGSAGATVWAENERGVAASGVSDPTGRVTFGGLMPGSYVFYARTASGLATRLGGADLGSGEVRSFKAKAGTGSSAISIEHLGANGRLYQLPVALTRGRTHTIYLGGKGLGAQTLVGTDARGINFDPNTLRLHDYGPNVTVISISVYIPHETVPGAFTIWARDKGGQQAYAIGGLVIR